MYQLLVKFYPKFIKLGESNIHKVPIGQTPRCKARITIHNKVPTRRRTSQPSLTVDTAIRIVLTLQR